MSYKPGKMGTAEGIALAFIICFPPVFLGTPAIGIEKVGSSGWVSVIPAAVVMTGSIYLLAYLYKQYDGDLIAISEQLLGKMAAKLICLYYIIMFFSIATFWIREFAENTLLTALPRVDFHLVVVWYALGAVVALYMGLEAIARAAYLLLPFIAGGLILTLIMLYPFCEFGYLLPWQGHGLDKLAMQSIDLIGTNAGAIILVVFAPAFQTAKSIRNSALFGIMGSCGLRTLAIFVFIAAFGSRIALEKTLPFYEMARLIYFSRYIQRIESLFIIVWVIVGILAISMAFYTGLYLLARFANLMSLKPLIPAVAIVLTQFAILPRDVTTTVELVLKLYTQFNLIGAVGIPVLLFLVAIVKGRRKKKICFHA